MKHSPGPWTVGKHAVPEGIYQSGIYSEDGVGRDLATVKSSAADAALMASAPALLEACRAAELLAAKVVAVSGLGARHEVVTDAITVRDAARAAIAKAEGDAG